MNDIHLEMFNQQSIGVIASELGTKKIVFVNNAVSELWEWENWENISSEIFWNKIENEKKDYIYDYLKSMDKVGQEYKFECVLTRTNGEKRYLLIMSKVIRISSGKKIRISSIVDISDKKKLEKKLIYMSDIDALTGINNRGGGQRKIDELLKKRKQGLFCLIDCDRFKLINDTYGHIAGDSVLTALAGCLKNSFRKRDIIMRLGGDEFAVYAVGVKNSEEAALCIERFFGRLERMDIKGMSDIKITVSLGAALYDGMLESSFNQIYDIADKKLYESKEKKGDTFSTSSL